MLTLVVLDLEAHPPPAAVTRVAVSAPSDPDQPGPGGSGSRPRRRRAISPPCSRASRPSSARTTGTPGSSTRTVPTPSRCRRSRPPTETGRRRAGGERGGPPAADARRARRRSGGLALRVRPARRVEVEAAGERRRAWIRARRRLEVRGPWRASGRTTVGHRGLGARRVGRGARRRRALPPSCATASPATGASTHLSTTDRVHRAARAVGVHVPRGRRAAGDARGRGGAARRCPPSRSSIATACTAPRGFTGPPRTPACADRRQRADARRRLAAAAARRGPRGLPEPLPRDHPLKLGAPKGGPRSRSTTSSRTPTGSCVSPAAPAAARAGPRPATIAARAAHLDRLVAIFGRVELLRRGAAPLRPRAGARPRAPGDAGARGAVPLVATNQPLYARPGGRAVADVFTCIREKTDLDHAGRRLWPQRRALRSRARRDGRALPRSARRAGQHRRAGAAPGLHAQGPRLSLPRLPAPARPDRLAHLRELTERGVRARYGDGPARARARRAGRARARAHRPARPRRLLPDRVGHRRVLPRPRHPGAGARLGGQQRGLLRARHHRGRSGRDGAPLRALPLPRSAASGRTSTSTCRAASGAKR